MPDPAPDILVVTSKIDPQELGRLTRAFFEDMVKYVVDVERGIAAVGSELNAGADVDAHRAALRCLLQLSPAGAAQIPYLLGGP